MFNRKIISEIEKWAKKKSRKPLVLRGARQVGKTTLVNQFSAQYKQYIYLNLELPEDKKPFEQFTNIDQLVQSLFFLKNKTLQKAKNTLIFIDEIQEVPNALNLLRYFYEQMPEINVIAAGSLLESLFDKNISFPVGRVEYLVVRPVSFPEFLAATGETSALTALQKVPLEAFTYDKLFSLFHLYTLIGGMPEIVNQYAESKDLTSLGNIYESLIVSYLDDVEKYAQSQNMAQVIRHAIHASFAEAGNRIRFHGFGKSNYSSREMGEALRTLEKSFFLQLIYPTTGTKLPILQDLRKSPRLHILDTGMLNYFSGIQKELIGTENLHNVYKGKIIEHITGQELLAAQFNPLSRLNFWVREKKTSDAEIDYLYTFEGKVIPIEIKSGAVGKLKSLHLYMDMTPPEQKLAIRFYAGQLGITKTKTPSGKTFHLLNLPYFLVSQLEYYIEWFYKEQHHLS